MKTPKIKKLNIPKILHTASSLAANGKLTLTANNLFYLDIDDAYIHQLYPLLASEEVKKPDYFGEKSGGAHITVIYPDENRKINKNDLGQKHHFTLKELVAAEIGLKTYYAILVEAPSLLEIRRQYALPDLLCFKGYAIGFHITIGIKKNIKLKL